MEFDLEGDDEAEVEEEKDSKGMGYSNVENVESSERRFKLELELELELEVVVEEEEEEVEIEMELEAKSELVSKSESKDDKTYGGVTKCAIKSLISRERRMITSISLPFRSLNFSFLSLFSYLRSNSINEMRHRYKSVVVDESIVTTF